MWLQTVPQNCLHTLYGTYTSGQFDAQVTDSLQPQIDENASAVTVPVAEVPAPHGGKAKVCIHASLCIWH